MLKRISTLAAVLALPLMAATAGAADIGYDPKADPFDALSSSVERAHDEGKLVLLVSGGDWCIWCHYLNAFLDVNEDVDRALHDVFVVAKVYVGDENRNEEFFANLPKADGAPHFWILSSTGGLLKSQPTVVLEDGNKSYDKDAFMKFIDGWRQRGH
jgi:thioredoxin-related protein